MPQAVDSISTLIEELSERLRDVERRLAALEACAIISNGTATPTRAARSGTATQPTRPEQQRLLPAFGSASGVFPTLGKAALGLAGAFLLRALTESGSVPKVPILLVAIVYAFGWMLWSTQPNWIVKHASGNSDRLASAVYAITSVLILCPLLWEATLRFRVLSVTTSSVVLVGFVAMSIALSGARNLQLIPWIATLSGLATALALIIATRELVPLTLALLAISLATELSVCFGHPLTFRVIPALVSDFSIWLVISILGSGAIPDGYHAVSQAVILLLCIFLPTIYITSIAIRGFKLRMPVTAFEIAQSGIAFSLGAFGILRVTQSSAALALGIAFLLLATVCYWGTLSRFTEKEHTRNRRVSAAWAAALLLAGTFLVLRPEFQVPCLCVAAAVTAIIYTQTAKTSLGLHASFYLAAAVASSPMPLYVASALAGTVPAAPEWRVWTVALAAALCYGIESHSSNDQGRRRLLWIVPASVAVFTAAAWIIAVVVQLVTARTELAASPLSTIRTIVICGTALGLGLASRHRHIELKWIAYAAVGLGTLKLLFEDLRFGNPASLVVSFLFYGMILILLPRLTRGTEP